MIQSTKLDAVANWLTAGAPPLVEFNEIVAEFARRLAASGMPLDRFGVYSTMIDPQLPGRLIY